MFKTNASCQQSWLESLASFKCLGGQLGPEPVQISDWRDRKGAQRTPSSFGSPTPAKKREETKRKNDACSSFSAQNSTVRSKVEEKSASLSPCHSLAVCVCACTQLNQREREGGGQERERGRWRVYAQRRKAPIQSLNLTRNSPARRKMC